MALNCLVTEKQHRGAGLIMKESTQHLLNFTDQQIGILVINCIFQQNYVTQCHYLVALNYAWPTGKNLRSSLVLPSREKMLTKAPYPRLSQFFLTAADCCDLAIFVGSSLRDDHIRDVAFSTASRVPVFIVNPEGESYGVDGAIPIAQHASTFYGINVYANALSSQRALMLP